MCVDKTGELELFSFETKMRKLILDLIHPTVERFNKEKEEYSVLKDNLETHNKRIRQLEMLVFHEGDEEGPKPVFEEIYERIGNEEKERRIQCSESLQKISELDTILKSVTFKVENQVKEFKLIVSTY